MKKLLIIPLLCICTFVSFQCSSQKDGKTTMLTYNNDDYLEDWKAVTAAENERKPKTALAKVEAIYDRAKKEDNHAQIIKALIHKGKYQSELEENGLKMAITGFKAELETASFPMKSILQSMLGEAYYNYQINNQYRFSNRTETVNFNPEDILTWSLNDFQKQSSDLYKKSLEDERLKNTSIDGFEPILTNGMNTVGMRSSLYDFLAHRAVDYFSNEQNYLTQPEYYFNIEDEKAFAPAAEFASHNFETSDTSSSKYLALSIYQDLMQSHLNDADPAALIDLDLKRLDFMNNNAVMPDKEGLYITALEQLLSKRKSHQSSTMVASKLATYYFNNANANATNPNEEIKDHLIKAHKICTEAIEAFPDSYGASTCRQTRANIEQKNLSFRTEMVNLPDEAILTSLNFRNVNKAWAKVVEISVKELRSIRRMQQNKVLNFINNKKAIKSWEVSIPKTEDFRNHQTEIKVDGLPLGVYLVVVADNPEFKKLNHAVTYTPYWVSNISDVYIRETEQSRFDVLHRKTGKPMEGVKLEFFEEQYRPIKRQTEFELIGSTTTNKDGVAYAQAVTENQQFNVKFSKGEDVLFRGNRYSNYRNQRNPRTSSITHFFLDRAIYRPGQTVHFKGLLLENDTERKPKIIANKKVTITLFDANHQKVKDMEFTTNSFGTIQGSFAAPEGGLNGQMHITSNVGNSRKYFRVEEYKRPKFEVDFKTLETAYKLGDQVTATGFAKAYAGNNIDGAKVQYRVIRNATFPYYPWWYFRGNRHGQSSPEMEITNGQTTTNEKGEFEIEFEAIANKSISDDKKPLYTYTVYADVTDINGETRSGQTQINIGYIALSANLLIPSLVAADSLKNIKISTKNLSGNFEAASGNLRVHRLKTPEQTYRKRFWQIPDIYSLTEAEYKRDFPNYSYGNENEYHNWERGQEILSTSFDTAEKDEIEFPKKLEPGRYIALLKTKDKYGKEVELEKHFTVFDLNKNKVPSNEISFVRLEKTSYEPGETANLFIGSAEKDVHVYVEFILKEKVISKDRFVLNGQQKVSLPIIEKYRGNINYNLFFVKENRFYSESGQILVPWSNKNLNIELASFRNKLLPGQEEEWKIKISGPKKEKVLAEFVGAMYDASLDEFAKNFWALNLWPNNYSNRQYRANAFGEAHSSMISENWNVWNFERQGRKYQNLNWFRFPFYAFRGGVVQTMTFSRNAAPMAAEADMDADGGSFEQMSKRKSSANLTAEKRLADTTAGLSYVDESWGNDNNVDDEQKTDFSDVPIRTNLNETVFFMPDLMTDADGNVILKFTMNEALTKWKFLGLAHTKDLQTGTITDEVITQKDLMVQPNAPRFFREGDTFEFTAKVSNLSEGDLAGTASLQLLDALTNQPVNDLLGLTDTEVPFQVAKGQSAPLTWKVKIPFGEVMAVTHRVVAKAGKFSDGEESSLPVLTNRMLVTETKPLPVRGNETKEFTFASMEKASASSTLSHHKFTLEYTSNPAWYAVQALPYLMEYPYDCTEQIFSRYYANSLASNAANSHPKIKQVFEQWRDKDVDALASNLSKNQELKSVLLEETPWVLQAQSEEEQKKNIGLLFDLNRMSKEQDQALNTIMDRQLSNGGFAWFPGGKDSWYITQYIVEGMGHLQRLGVIDFNNTTAGKGGPQLGDERVNRVLNSALTYIDDRIVEHYENMKKYSKNIDDDHLDQMAIHYLYARSFFDKQQSKKAVKISEYYLGQAEKYWVDKSLYMQSMLALVLNRNERTATAKTMIESFDERAIRNEELGMYYKQDYGWFWYELPIETHSLMIEVYDEVAKDEKAVEELKIWLLKNKQTTHWKTTKATASAVYVLMMSGDNWLLEDKLVDIEIAGKKLSKKDLNIEAGTGYFKTSWDGKEVKNSMANITVKNPNNVVAWGAAYWQYFEQLDKIETFEDTPLTLKKQLFKELPSDTGPVISPLVSGEQLSVGDKVIVRIELRVDRDMEYVHMKDLRASGFEPINVISRYKWQDGLGYYESTKDAGTHFFIDYLRKGTYVFEYPLRVAHRGDFSNGVTTIQCMYAPEFTSHSEGIRVTVK